MRSAIYARVSTTDQEPENQLAELRRYITARGWTAGTEYIDKGVSGAKERRPSLDQLLSDARRRRFDVLVVWSLDRIGRNLRHLIGVLEDLQQLGVAVVSLRDGLDLSTAAGRLQMAVIAAIAQFERDRLRERTTAGLARAKAQGKQLGRRMTIVDPESLQAVSGLSLRLAARQLGIAVNTLQKARRLYQQTSSMDVAKLAENSTDSRVSGP
jgi:DNA invertase Pin-like site-specific DNA recombinase